MERGIKLHTANMATRIPISYTISGIKYTFEITSEELKQFGSGKRVGDILRRSLMKYMHDHDMKTLMYIGDSTIAFTAQEIWMCMMGTQLELSTMLKLTLLRGDSGSVMNEQKDEMIDVSN